MGIATWAQDSLVCLPNHARLHKQPCPSSVVCCRRHFQIHRNALWIKRRRSWIDDVFSGVSSIRSNASQVDRGDASFDIPLSSQNGDVDFGIDERRKLKIALSEAVSKQEDAEKDRDRLVQELAHAKTKIEEYASIIEDNKQLAVSELESAKSLFNHKLQEAVNEKFALESKLILAKQDAVDLAVQVEKLAEASFQQATSHILEDALLRVSAAETSAAEAAYRIEEQIKVATEDTIVSMVNQSTETINKALAAAEEASSQARKAVASLSSGVNVISEVALIRTENLCLQNAVTNLESQVLIAKNEIDGLRLELEKARALTKASDDRAIAAEKALLDLQELFHKSSSEMEEEIKSLLEKMKKEAMGREKAAMKAFKVELESIVASVEASKEAAHLRDQAYMRRCAALEQSLKTAETALEVWRQRAENAESLLHGERMLGDEVSYHISGGRIDVLTDDDSQKWKLLAEGPRRPIPEWMARRIRAIFPKFPPRKVENSEAFFDEKLSLRLPNLEKVWSISEEEPKDSELFVQSVVDKEIIEKKRKALERALQRKTVKGQKTPEQTKLEPGTGTGREIVFQGFNWESWRRRWYMELTPKAADLSQSGITAIWLPPPTESVAPQGYMPSDLYNLNSAYGSVDELKQCIEEMHAQDLLVLGDVVLNHRCAQKQSSNGIWNIFGGKLSWGPEAIVCDDPNFQGRGNPSTGDIFHAAPNIDHSQQFVRKDIKEWLNWLRNDIGYDGWRLDFVRGFSGVYVKEYIEASSPAFAIGEYWDSLAYERGNLSYNQDAHRQRIVNWINATGGTSSAFDVTTKGILHSALHNQYWRLIDPQGKPTGVMGWWSSRAVTFLENHDTGSTQGHWPFPRDKLSQGYAYILTHPGTPVVFYDHFYDFGLRDVIVGLIEARRRAGIHCRSTVKIYHANNEGYVSKVDETLVVKLGSFDWNPSKENHLDGTWRNFVDKGSDYQVWLRQ